MAKDVEIVLPVLHDDQVKAFLIESDARGGVWAGNTGRFKAVRCGRRWGKTDLMKTVASDGAAKGEIIGWFAPDWKVISEAYEEIADILAPIKKGASKQHGYFRTTTGGRIDFWTLENERAGRSRKYHKVLIDEAAFTKPNMLDLWNKNIYPTLLDYDGEAIVASNTNGEDPDNFFWQICNQPEHGFVEYHAPTINNPYVPERKPGETEEDHWKRRLATIEAIRLTKHPYVFRQEYLAEFIDWSGVAFFSLDKLLVGGVPVEHPMPCDYVFAIVDSATKTGSENDGTAVTFFARSRLGAYPLVVLDWDIVQIEGAMLENWLPGVMLTVEELAKKCRARGGVAGVFIEDKDSGQVLLQQARKKFPNVHAIDSKLTSVGKDERAINISGYVYNEKVKISTHAHDKVVTFKGVTRNHFITQITGFRVGDKNSARRADDLLDTFTYGVALSLGGAGGF